MMPTTSISTHTTPGACPRGTLENYFPPRHFARLRSCVPRRKFVRLRFPRAKFGHGVCLWLQASVATCGGTSPFAIDHEPRIPPLFNGLLKPQPISSWMRSSGRHQTQPTPQSPGRPRGSDRQSRLTKEPSQWTATASTLRLPALHTTILPSGPGPHGPV